MADFFVWGTGTETMSLYRPPRSQMLNLAIIFFPHGPFFHPLARFVCIKHNYRRGAVCTQVVCKWIVGSTHIYHWDGINLGALHYL